MALQPNGINMNFARGHGILNMERGGVNDLGKALFQNIEEYHAGNLWTVTNDLSVYFDHDFEYGLVTPDEHTANIVK